MPMVMNTGCQENMIGYPPESSLMLGANTATRTRTVETTEQTRTALDKSHMPPAQEDAVGADSPTTFRGQSLTLRTCPPSPSWISSLSLQLPVDQVHIPLGLSLVWPAVMTARGGALFVAASICTNRRVPQPPT